MSSDLTARFSNLSPAKRELLRMRVNRRAARPAAPPRAVASEYKMTVEQLLAEATLDPDIVPPVTSASAQGRTGSVFLTGATGFLGAFLLHELLTQTDATIHCLVRAEDVARGRQRISDNVNAYLPDVELPQHRIVPVPGDLAQPRLGFSDRLFQQLGEQLDVIHHCGALVKWTFPFSATRPANVEGTQEVLRLAGTSRLKPIHFISTVGVFSSPEYGSSVVREHQRLEDSGPLYVGYAQSKWVAEHLVRQASVRGFPVSIYRPNIAAHSVTGAYNPHDHVHLMLKGCVELGLAPYLDFTVSGAPVDFVSKAIVHLAERDHASGECFHLVNPRDISWSDIIAWVNSRGYPVRQVPYQEWVAALLKSLTESRNNALMALSTMFSESMLDYIRLPTFEVTETDTRLRPNNLTCPPLDAKLLDTIFIHNGFLGGPTKR